MQAAVHQADASRTTAVLVLRRGVATWPQLQHCGDAAQGLEEQADPDVALAWVSKLLLSCRHLLLKHFLQCSCSQRLLNPCEDCRSEMLFNEELVGILAAPQKGTNITDCQWPLSARAISNRGPFTLCQAIPGPKETELGGPHLGGPFLLRFPVASLCLLLGCTRRGLTLRKDVFLLSKHLLSAFYETLPSKNLVLLKTLTGAF